MPVGIYISVLMDELKRPNVLQKDIAQTYRLAIECNLLDEVDWSIINKAIIKRWSKSGLERIKKMAWSGKCFK